MSDDQACAICGANVRDMDLHAAFHSTDDIFGRTAIDASPDALEALEKAESASNILDQRGIA